MPRRQLSAWGDAAGALGRRLAASDAPAQPAAHAGHGDARELRHSRGLALLSLARISVAMQYIFELEEPLGGMSVGRNVCAPLAGHLKWPIAVLVAAPAVLPGVTPATNRQLHATVMHAAGMYLGNLEEWAGKSAAHAAALAETHAVLLSFVRALAYDAGRLAMPGQDLYNPREWIYLVALLNTLVGSEEFGGTATAALAADAPGGKPGPRLAAALLEVICCLARAGPPAACGTGPEGGAGGPAAEGSEDVCLREVAVLLGSQALRAITSVVAARGDVGTRVLSQLAGLMGRLHARQQGAAARRPAPPMPEQAHAQLDVAEAACLISTTMLADYAGVLEALLPAGEPAVQRPHLPARESVLRAVSAGVQYMWHVLHLLPPTAAALAVVAQALANETETDDHPMGHAICCFGAVVATAARMLELARRCGSPGTAQSQAEVLAGVEASLRCFPILHRFAPGAAADLPSIAVMCAGAGAALLNSWAGSSDPPLTPEEAERLLVAVAALASTVCKVSVHYAEAASEAATLGAPKDAAGAAAALDGAGPADGAEARTLPAQLAARLLMLAGSCRGLASVLSRLAAPSERVGRLLRCVVLQHAESAVRLLPLKPHGAEQHAVLWGELPPTLPLAQQQGEEAAASLRALAEARRCCHMGCTALDGSSDAELRTKLCTGCRVARFCSDACSNAAWRVGHRQVCRLLAAQATQAAAGQEQQHAAAV